VSLVQPLKWWGGKHYLAKQIIARMPPHLHYVEPYAGGLAVLLEREPSAEALFWGKECYHKGVSEVVNDIHRELTNFWRVLQREDTFDMFFREVQATPFSQIEWEEAGARMVPVSDPDPAAAAAFFVRCRQSRAGGLRMVPVSDPDPAAAAAFFVRCRQSRAGGFRSFGTLSRRRTRRQMSEQASAWWNCVDGLPAVAARLRRVVILNQPAVDVIRQQDGEATLYYLDPPYVHETRAATSAYQHEMTEDDHRELLATIRGCRGKVILSGYPNRLYDQELADWRRDDIQIDNKAAGGGKKQRMIESLWMNF